ncbi:PCI domain-containing protein [Besnoitia besnoiti]|uniref:PCI domain-containing protein n=1 Tax=Besnoitia besnoiti TaxID=94643 RepID=A0A2A9M194_BESBE|nr:PCI domain-containing protein [Besnoitia besnoiti]PFH31755.1 PCI domain-containing protein [Besnoitia besnoiti]
MAATSSAASGTGSVPAPESDASLANSSAEAEKKKLEALFAAASPQMQALLKHPAGEVKKPEQRLEEEKTAHPEAAALLQQIANVLTSKLYHEFTMAAFAYLAPLALGESSSPYERPSPPPQFTGFDRVEFFYYVVGPLRSKLDESAFLRLLAAVCEDIDAKDALLFLSHYPLSEGSAGADPGTGQGSGLRSSVFASRTSSSGASSAVDNGAAAAVLEAEILYKTCQSFHLSQCRNFADSEEILDELQKKLNDSTVGVSPVAQAAFQRAAATLAKAQAKHAEFYHHAIIFLAYTPTASIPERDRVGLAYEIAIAALVAPDIFNFGEVMQQALILSTLKTQPEHQWLWALLEAFHCGSLPQYDSICAEYATQINATALAHHAVALRQKIATAALLRLAFTRSAAGTAAGAAEASGTASDAPNGAPAAGSAAAVAAGGAGVSAASRSLSFDVIAKACKVAETDVEPLVMRAMSQKLMRGTIDQVKRQVFVTWVRPALLLDETGLSYLQDRLLRWIGAAEQLHKQLQVQTAELLGS